MLSPITFRFSQGPRLTPAQQHRSKSFNKMLAGCTQIGHAGPAGGDGPGEERRTVNHAKPQQEEEGGGASGKVQRG